MPNPYEPPSELEPEDPAPVEAPNRAPVEAPSRVWIGWGLLAATCFASTSLFPDPMGWMDEVVIVGLYVAGTAFAVKCIISHTDLVEKFDERRKRGDDDELGK